MVLQMFLKNHKTSTTAVGKLMVFSKQRVKTLEIWRSSQLNFDAALSLCLS